MTASDGTAPALRGGAASDTDRAAADPRVLFALRAVCLVAVAFSAAALVEGPRGHMFCARGSGCDAVRESALGQLLGPQLPLLGTVGFTCVLLASLFGRGLWQRASLAFAITGGAAGLALLGLQQFAIGALCQLCVGVDLAAVVAGVLAWRLSLAAPTPPVSGWPRRIAWCAAVALALAASPLWARTHPEPAPAFVRALARPGVVTVVELSDFECPYCRGMHPVLHDLLARYGRRVRLVRKSIPLPGHRHARDAARAYLCANALGRGDQMADVLFTSDALAEQDCARYASALGLDSKQFAHCMADPATAEQITRDVQAVIAAGLEGLPTVWIGRTRIVGFDRDAGDEPYADALDRALRELKPAR